MSWNFLNLTDLARKDYSSLFLKRNPFPASTVPEEIPQFTADRTEEKKQFKEAISDLIHDNKSSVTVYVGEYGSGKSHLMRAFKHVVKQQLFNFEKGVFPIYIKTPGRNFLDFYHEAVEDITRKNLETFAEKILKDFLDQHRNKSKFIYTKKAKIQPDNMKDFVDKSMAVDMFKELANARFPDLKNHDVFFALFNILRPSLSAFAWRWFLGAKLSKDELRTINVTSNIDSSPEAYVIFRDLITLIKSTGINSIILYIDEFENITNVPSNLRAIYQNTLRCLIDDFPQNMVLFFAIAPYQWNELTKQRTALVRRLEDNVLQLDFFTKEQAKDLIQQYLNSSRLPMPEKTSAGGNYGKLYPFTDEAIDEITISTKGVSSDIIKLCRRCIEDLIETRSNTVTVEIVKKHQN